MYTIRNLEDLFAFAFGVFMLLWLSMVLGGPDYVTLAFFCFLCAAFNAAGYMFMLLLRILFGADLRLGDE